MSKGEAKKAAAKRGYQNLKKDILLHYTIPPIPESLVPKCADCGEEDMDVLILHHSGLNGNEDRKLYGRNLWRNLQDKGYPEGFKVLCANCHLKRHKKLNEHS